MRSLARKSPNTTLLPFLLLLLQLPLPANTIVDSLKAELKQPHHDTVTIQLYNWIAAELKEDFKLTDSAVYYAGRAHQLALKANYKQGKAEAAYNLAYAYDMGGKLKDALKHYELARQYYTAIGNKAWIAQSMHGKGVACYFQSDYGKSLEYYMEALTFEREQGLLEMEANTLLNMGVVYRLMENYEEAITINQRNIKIRKQLNDSINLAKVYK